VNGLFREIILASPLEAVQFGADAPEPTLFSADHRAETVKLTDSLPKNNLL
jgi:hypothetical protein